VEAFSVRRTRCARSSVYGALQKPVDPRKGEHESLESVHEALIIFHNALERYSIAFEAFENFPESVVDALENVQYCLECLHNV